ncbi:hypothetical protein HZ326_25245 [Fusarium oxysporum f. sp. albedinis]|nr:hypothetical protein HZ326_25245 [Fusarium oxysporum f. sp. albedinis]
MRFCLRASFSGQFPLFLHDIAIFPSDLDDLGETERAKLVRKIYIKLSIPGYLPSGSISPRYTPKESRQEPFRSLMSASSRW